MKTILFLLLFVSSFFCFAGAPKGYTVVPYYDSLLPQTAITSRNVGMFLDLLDAEVGYRQSGNTRRAMVRMLKIAGLKKTISGNRLSTRLFSDLSRISAMLKMYPLAMKFYEKALHTNSKPLYLSRESGEVHFINDSIAFAQLIKLDTAEIQFSDAEAIKESQPVLTEEIVQSFNDHKTAVSFVILIHVKQPRAKSRKAFTGINNVGHTFITLIKYNDDQSYVSRSFGFYPSKKNFFAATPIHPTDLPVFKDDYRHDWDELAAKFISREKFEQILQQLQHFKKKKYNLNSNNCTDFGLNAAVIAGINIQETRGSWPLGVGNNPANAGQSLLENKFNNKDSLNPATLMVNGDLESSNQ